MLGPDRKMLVGIAMLVDVSIMELAKYRELMIKTGAPEDAVTEFISKQGELHAKRFRDMTLDELIKEL